MSVHARILPLPAPHPADCPVCGGAGRVRVHPLRWHGGTVRAVWVSYAVSCPLRPGADDLLSHDLLSLLPRDTGDGAS